MGEYFANGGSHLESEHAFNNYTAKNGKVGYDSNENDPKGSCYWADKDNMDPIWQHHDSNIAEHELGFDKGDLKDQYRYRVDCDDLSSHNQRIASGHERGANDNFTGITIDSNGNKIIDPDIYNQRTKGGQPECVTDQIPLSSCSVSNAQKFDDPNQNANFICKQADKISSLPESDAKENKLNHWNKEADALKDRISGEQDYLNSRINDHEKRMSEFREGSLEYNRAKDNRDWCQNYINDLTESKNMLQNKQDELNSSVSKNDSSQFNISNYIPDHSQSNSSLNSGMGIG